MSLHSDRRRVPAAAGALSLCLIAVLAIWVNAPAATVSPDARLLAWVLSGLPFALLMGVAVAAFLSYEALMAALGNDHRFFDRIREEPDGARTLLGDAGPASPTFASQLGADRQSSLVATGLDGVLRRRVAGEHFSVAGLRQDLETFAAGRTNTLHVLHLAAFGVGLGGTVFGLVLQLRIAGDIAATGLISDDFLNGILLKASCTLVGLCVAWFAWALRESMAHAHDRLASDLEEFVCLELGQVLSRTADTATDPARLVEIMVREMRPILLGVADAIREGVSISVTQAAEQLRTTVIADFTRAIDQSLVAPFTAEVQGIVRNLAAIETEIRRAADGVTAVGEAFSTNLTGTGIALEHLVQQITTAAAAAQGVAGSLQSVRGGLVDVIGQIRPLRDELVGTVETLRHIPSPGLQKDVVADLVRLSEMVYRTLGTVNGSSAERTSR